MRKHDEIMIGLDSLSRKISNLEKLASDKAVKLEQALNRAESQRDTFKHQRDAALAELEELRTENEELKRELHALDGRLRHLFQSKTLQLFDEKNRQGGYKYDIKLLDIHNTLFQCLSCKHEKIAVGLAPCITCKDHNNWELKEGTETCRK